MPTIGKTTDGNSWISGSNEAFAFHDPTFLYTAAAGDVVTKAHIFSWYGGIGTVPQPGRVQIYEYDTGTNQITNKVGAAILVPVTNAATWEDSAAVSIPLTAGLTYTIAIYDDNDQIWYRETFSGTDMGVETPSPPSDPFNQTGIRASNKAAYVDVENSGPPPTSDIIFPCCAQLIS